MKKGDKLFIADLKSVSFFNEERLKNIASNDSEYFKIPFLYLVMSYMKNSALSLANQDLKFLNRKEAYSWTIYEFIYE